MSCAFSRTLLALHVEGDLSQSQAGRTAMHLAACAECRQFVNELHASQTLLRSLRRETVERDACAGMRQNVMRIIEDGQLRTGWWLRLERALFGVRAWHAVAAALLVSIVSVSVLAQMRQPSSDSTGDSKMAAAVFEGRDVLLRPEGYADWFVVGVSEGRHHPGGKAGGKIFMNPASYREYAKTGRFPEGTMMVLASGEPGGALLASVKDRSRFDAGWGFFEFAARTGAGVAGASALPDSSGCRTCHRRDAATDHVFTQFYPALRSSTHT